MSSVARALAAQQEQRRQQLLFGSRLAALYEQKESTMEERVKGKAGTAAEAGEVGGQQQQAASPTDAQADPPAPLPPPLGPCRSQSQAEAVLRRLHPTATFLAAAQHSRRRGLTSLGGLASGAPAVPPPGQWRKPLPWAHLAQREAEGASTSPTPFPTAAECRSDDGSFHSLSDGATAHDGAEELHDVYDSFGEETAAVTGAAAGVGNGSKGGRAVAAAPPGSKSLSARAGAASGIQAELLRAAQALQAADAWLSGHGGGERGLALLWRPVEGTRAAAKAQADLQQEAKSVHDICIQLATEVAGPSGVPALRVTVADNIAALLEDGRKLTTHSENIAGEHWNAVKDYLPAIVLHAASDTEQNRMELLRHLARMSGSSNVGGDGQDAEALLTAFVTALQHGIIRSRWRSVLEAAQEPTTGTPATMGVVAALALCGMALMTTFMQWKEVAEMEPITCAATMACFRFMTEAHPAAPASPVHVYDTLAVVLLPPPVPLLLLQPQHAAAPPLSAPPAALSFSHLLETARRLHDQLAATLAWVELAYAVNARGVGCSGNLRKHVLDVVATELEDWLCESQSKLRQQQQLKRQQQQPGTLKQPPTPTGQQQQQQQLVLGGDGVIGGAGVGGGGDYDSIDDWPELPLELLETGRGVLQFCREAAALPLMAVAKQQETPAAAAPSLQRPDGADRGKSKRPQQQALPPPRGMGTAAGGPLLHGLGQGQQEGRLRLTVEGAEHAALVLLCLQMETIFDSPDLPGSNCGFQTLCPAAAKGTAGATPSTSAAALAAPAASAAASTSSAPGLAPTRLELEVFRLSGPLRGKLHVPSQTAWPWKRMENNIGKANGKSRVSDVAKSMKKVLDDLGAMWIQSTGVEGALRVIQAVGRVRHDWLADGRDVCAMVTTVKSYGDVAGGEHGEKGLDTTTTKEAKNAKNAKNYKGGEKDRPAEGDQQADMGGMAGKQPQQFSALDRAHGRLSCLLNRLLLPPPSLAGGRGGLEVAEELEISREADLAAGRILQLLTPPAVAVEAAMAAAGAAAGQDGGASSSRLGAGMGAAGCAGPGAVQRSARQGLVLEVMVVECVVGRPWELVPPVAGSRKQQLQEVLSRV